MAGLNVGSVIAHLKLDSSHFESGIRRSMKTMVSSVKHMTHTINRWVKRGLIAMTAYMAASVKAFSSFEDAMVRSAAVTEKATGSMLGAMKRMALQMSKESILSARELAEGYFALGQAGFTAAQSIKALPVVTDFAVASQVKLDTATRYLVRTLEGLGMASTNATQNMQQMERVSNAFTYAAIKTTAEIQDFAVAMTHAAAPALRLVNKSMEEGTAVLMAFARAGIVAEEAGTLLWTTVRDLQRANLKARHEWEKLGIKVYDVTGTMRNLADIFGDLEKKFADMSDESKKAALELLGFQDRSLRGIQALMGFSKEMKKFEKRMKSLTKLTRDIAEKYMKSFLSAMKMLWHQVVDVSIAVGQRLAPAIRGLAEDFAHNQGVIKEWVVAVADKMARAVEHIRKFVRYVRYDMGGGIQLGLDIVKIIFKKFGLALAIILEEIFVKLGANIAVWFQRGFAKRLELGKVSDEMLHKAMGVKSSWERYFKMLLMDKEDFAKYMKQSEVAQREAIERLSTGYFKQIAEEAYPTIPIDFAVVEGSLERIIAEGKAEIAKLTKDSATWFDFGQTMPEIKKQWQILFANLKRDTEPFYDHLRLSTFKWAERFKYQIEVIGNIFKEEKFEPKVIDRKTIQEAERSIRRMLATMDLELNLLDEHFVKRERILKLMPLFAEYEKMYGEYMKDNIILWSDFQRVQFSDAMEEHEKFLVRLREKQRSFVAFSDQIAEWVDTVTNAWENFGRAAVNAINSFADTLAEQLEKGKADWKAFGAAALREINRIIIKMLMVETIKGLFGESDKSAEMAATASAANANAAAAAAAASAAQAAASAALAAAIAAGSAPAGMTAAIAGGIAGGGGGGGGVPPGTSPQVALGAIFNMGKMLAFARGVVVSGPTAFGMRNNRTGLMGEAGPEAIMPLTRTTSGELGVKATQPNINFNPQVKLIIVRNEKEAQLEAMRSSAGEKIIVQKVARNKNVLG